MKNIVLKRSVPRLLGLIVAVGAGPAIAGEVRALEQPPILRNWQAWANQ